jgi:hypothetical protein
VDVGWWLVGRVTVVVTVVRWCGKVPVRDGAERVVDRVGMRADSFLKDAA